MKKLLTLLVSVFVATTMSFAQAGQGGFGTVMEIIESSPDHQTLTAAINAAGLADALNGDGPFTVFAPNDAAFGALPPGVVDELLADPSGLLTEILLYHVVFGAAVESVQLEDGQMITTMNGGDITVMLFGGVFINETSEVIQADLIAGNGVVHVVNEVLLPPAPFTVWDVVQESEIHDILEAAVLAAGLDGALSDPDAELTLFAPTDEAFAALPDGLIDDLLADPSGLLTDILLYHVVGSVALSTDLSDGQMITTLNGADVTVTFDGGNVFINDAQVILADIVTDNGVVHVIDAVLVPAAPFTVWDVVQESEIHDIL
ncbi:MAG: fasciclin domain-containing protein, partial [Cryomorphaceae bacterium]